MIRVSILAAAGLLAFTAAGQAAPELVRVRGTVESATDSSITVKTKDGGTQQIALKPETAFLNVVKSSLDQVGDGKFIGTATKGDNPPVALEVVIFPEAMRGTGEG
ncbi:metal ABC transporter permease, partial [Chenggangzhangella methanolivorans]